MKWRENINSHTIICSNDWKEQVVVSIDRIGPLFKVRETYYGFDKDYSTVPTWHATYQGACNNMEKRCRQIRVIEMVADLDD